METAETIIGNKLTYRLFEKGDEEGILRLWEKDSGWGAITIQQFNEWFIDTPYGDCLLVVAVDEENIIRGQIVYAPSRVVVDGVEIRSLRGAAPIVDSSIRQFNLRNPAHPAINLITKGFEFAIEAGYQLVYGFPAIGWVPVLQTIDRLVPYSLQTSIHDCFAISLNHDQNANINGYQTTLVDAYTSEHEILSQEAIAQMPIHCMIARREDWINRLTAGTFKLETRSDSDGRLLGFMSVKKDGLMIDLMARTIEDLKIVFEQSLAALRAYHNKKTLPFGMLKGMITKETGTFLKHIAYDRDSYQFAFVCWKIDEDLDIENLKTSRWYLMPLG